MIKIARYNPFGDNATLYLVLHHIDVSEDCVMVIAYKEEGEEWKSFCRIGYDKISSFESMECVDVNTEIAALAALTKVVSNKFEKEDLLLELNTWKLKEQACSDRVKYIESRLKELE